MSTVSLAAFQATSLAHCHPSISSSDCSDVWGYDCLFRLIEKYAMGTQINPEMIPAFQNGNPKNTIAQYMANTNATEITILI
ncbi:hypothetical protein ACFONB_02665 [Sphingopyxis italica]